MRLRRRTPAPPPDRDLAADLRDAARRLRGWTVSGSSLDLDGLLHAAAAEIDRLTREVALLQDEPNAWPG